MPELLRRSLAGFGGSLRPAALRAALDRRAAFALAILAASFTLGAGWVVGLGHNIAMGSVGPGAVPAVRGYQGGASVRFLHTEASSAAVAKVLTQMTRSPVLVVPQLADVPAAARADVYTFANGVKGAGPLGFQRDVFDSAPGAGRYSPLRTLDLVRWANGVKPRELHSAAEVQATARRGALRIARPGIVVNMPFLAWPGASARAEVPVTGFFAGQSVSFLHTESSSGKVARLLTRMTRSPVLVVPQIANVPAAARANVYVFANGVKGGGPLGFQRDVFDSAPAAGRYSPLRTLNLVRWSAT